MPSPRTVFRRLSDRLVGTPFDRALRASRDTHSCRFLFFWNRGMGDIALGLMPLFDRLRSAHPGARIEVITRDDLEQPFLLAGADRVHLAPGLERGYDPEFGQLVTRLGLDQQAFAAVFPRPDPSRWLAGSEGLPPPQLAWQASWNDLADRLVPEEPGVVNIGVHVQTETNHLYGYVKDWPASSWQALFGLFGAQDQVRWLLFGHTARPSFEGSAVLDLRGRTDVLELLSLIRNRCRILIAPDSGVLTFAYYLSGPFPIDLISLWSDPLQGILKKRGASPNIALRHVPIVGPDGDITRIEVPTVASALRSALSRARRPARSPAT